LVAGFICAPVSGDRTVTAGILRLLATKLPQTRYDHHVPVAPELAEQLAAISEEVREKRKAVPTTRRDMLIRDAYEQGGGVREIARLTGLTHEAVRKILAKP